MLGYRLVEIKNGKVMSLFHGTDGSRVIPLDVWHKANKKSVRDGSNGQRYESGWHFLKSKEDAINFFDRMFRVKDNRYIIECQVKGNIRVKNHSTKGKCWLADELFIRKEDIDAILE